MHLAIITDALCNAQSRRFLSQCLIAILGKIFAEDRGLLHLQIVLPTSSARALNVHFSSLQGTTGAAIHLQTGDSAFTDERLVDCTGTLDALTKLLRQLLAVLEFPLPYQRGTQYGIPAEPPPSRPGIDLPLNTVFSRSELCGLPSCQLHCKRAAEKEAHRDAKAAKLSAGRVWSG